MTPDPSKLVHILVPPSWDTTARGNFLESCAAQLLQRQRYAVQQRVRFTGMEVDVLARHKDGGETAFVECKFHRDPLSANIVDLLLGQALRRGADKALLFSTAMPGKEAAGAIQELAAGPQGRGPRFAFCGPDVLLETFVDLYDPHGAVARRQWPASTASVALVITAGSPAFWAIESTTAGVPSAVEVVFPAATRDPLGAEACRALFDDHSLYVGLPVAVRGAPDTLASVVALPVTELVTPIATADALDDYRPCNPEGFVGRKELQQQMLTFFGMVRNRSTTTRIISLVGASGFGKSSLVARLAHRCRNKQWRKAFYLYGVDVRSAQTPLYIARALVAALRSAAEDQFIIASPEDISVGGTDALLESASVRSCLDELRRTNRVLIVFFDQFEELFNKDELLPLFDAFKRLAFEVNAAQANIVLGFSWRTGISLSDTNPAYHVWHDLADMRFERPVGVFTREESSELLGQFEEALGERLNTPLRRRLEDQGELRPWLLKKLCIHVYREIRNGVSQTALVERRLNVKALFDADLAPLDEQQIKCLRFIAANSPADAFDVASTFDTAVVNALYSRRLIVRTGQRYAVYWDIFRDYLKDGVVPAIPWAFVPHATLSMDLRALAEIQAHPGVATDALARLLGYSERTVYNMIVDLSHLLLAHRNEEGGYVVNAAIQAADTIAVAEHLRRIFREHEIVQRLARAVKPGASVDRLEFLEIVRDTYRSADVTPETRDNYLGRLLPWLEFAGLVEVKGDLLVRPLHMARGFAMTSGDAGWRRRGTQFLAVTGPQIALTLLNELVMVGPRSRPDIVSSKLRNAAVDLTTLALARWVDGSLFPLVAAASPDEIEARFRRAVDAAEVVGAYRHVRSRNVVAAPQDLAEPLRLVLQKKWAPASAIRYATGVSRYVAFLEGHGPE